MKWRKDDKEMRWGGLKMPVKVEQSHCSLISLVFRHYRQIRRQMKSRKCILQPRSLPEDQTERRGRRVT